MATISNLSIDQGTDYSVTVTVTDTTGSARDLTDYTAKSQLRRSYYTNSNIAFDVNIYNPGIGEITLEMNSATTGNLKPGRYVYDLELKSNSTLQIERIVEGIVTVYPEVTR